MISSRSGSLNDAICCARRCAISSSNVSVGPRVQHDAGARLLAEDRIGHGDDADLPDLGEAEDQVLDLVAADLLAAAVDEVLPAAFGVDVAAALPDDVAHPVEAVGRERLGVDLGRRCSSREWCTALSSPVRPARRRAPGDPASSSTAISSNSLTGAPELSSSRSSASVEPRHVDEAFGGAVDLLRRAAELVAKTGAQLRRQARAAVLNDLQRRDVELLRDVAVQPRRDQRNDRGHVGHAFACDGREHLVGVGAPWR